MFTNTVVAVLIIASLIAQKPFAATYRPGHWQPAIRVDPEKPLQLVLTNRAKTDISYSFLDGRASERKIAPERSVQINKVALPLDLSIFNPIRTGVIDTEIKYDLVYEPAKNQLIVNIVPVKNSDSTTINVDKNGGVYLY